MQHRMRTHQLSREEMEQLLEREQMACLATVNADGTPYVTPVHFLYWNGCIYLHGLPAGQKLENIKANPAVSLSVYRMEEFLLDPKGNPCDTNTKYKSIIIQRRAERLTDPAKKEAVLRSLVRKYTPHLAQHELPRAMTEGTAVLEIQIGEMTGKYYP